MALTAGIIGLPNIGKSTLFNAITNSTIEVANYPFATISPNVGVVVVPDERLYQLGAIFPDKRQIPTTFEFIDIAGLVQGASTGEGLGNQFLSHIREVDAIVHVVRCFDDENIIHVEASVDPISDVEIVELELALADLAIIENRMERLARRLKVKDKDALYEIKLLEKCKTTLENGDLISSLAFDELQKRTLKSFHLLTDKPVIYVANMDFDEISDPQSNAYYNKLVEYAQTRQAKVVPICAKLEEELASEDKKQRMELLSELSILNSGLDQIIISTYELLDLGTFFTVGDKEVQAWTFTHGMKAPACGGIIHTDFERGFIRVEAYSLYDIVQYQSEQVLKEAGKLRVEGKQYRVQDGDVLYFRFNV